MADTVGARISSSVCSLRVIARPGLLLGGALAVGVAAQSPAMKGVVVWSGAWGGTWLGLLSWAWWSWRGVAIGWPRRRQQVEWL